MEAMHTKEELEIAEEFTRVLTDALVARRAGSLTLDQMTASLKARVEASALPFDLYLKAIQAAERAADIECRRVQ